MTLRSTSTRLQTSLSFSFQFCYYIRSLSRSSSQHGVTDSLSAFAITADSRFKQIAEERPLRVRVRHCSREKFVSRVLTLTVRLRDYRSYGSRVSRRFKNSFPYAPQTRRLDTSDGHSTRIQSSRKPSNFVPTVARARRLFASVLWCTWMKIFNLTLSFSVLRMAIRRQRLRKSNEINIRRWARAERYLACTHVGKRE